MITVNPFAELAVSVPPAAMKLYVIFMIFFELIGNSNTDHETV